MAEKMSYEDLEKQYFRFQVELEQAHQALYDCRRQIKTIQTLDAEYQDEIKALQAEVVSEREKCETRIQQLEESNSSTRSAYNDRVSCLEKEVSDKDDEVKDVKRQLDEIIRITETREPQTDDTLIEEFAHLREENVELSEHAAELQKSVESKDRENDALHDRIRQFEEELNSYKEILDGKREELNEANTLVQNLKDELLCAKSELDSVKSRPLDDQSRGNSLFAEVDDRRLQLQHNMKEMKTRYVDMKREHTNLLKQITTLRNENTELLIKWKAEIEGKQYDEEMIINTYKYQVQTLNELLESYQKELKEKSNGDDPSVPEIKFFDKLLTTKNKEIEGLRQKLSIMSFNHTSSSYDLAEANRQSRKQNLEILELRNEIGDLKTQMQEIALKSPIETAPPPREEQAIKSIVKNSNPEDDKENGATTNKKVQFTETTLESNVTDRSKLRKGTKILTALPIKYS